jgi:hypothetical protein
MKAPAARPPQEGGTCRGLHGLLKTHASVRHGAASDTTAVTGSGSVPFMMPGPSAIPINLHSRRLASCPLPGSVVLERAPTNAGLDELKYRRPVGVPFAPLSIFAPYDRRQRMRPRGFLCALPQDPARDQSLCTSGSHVGRDPLDARRSGRADAVCGVLAVRIGSLAALHIASLRPAQVFPHRRPRRSSALVAIACSTPRTSSFVAHSVKRPEPSEDSTSPRGSDVRGVDGFRLRHAWSKSSEAPQIAE